VTVCSGERISPIDLHHEELPDPVLEMFNTIERRLDRIERKIKKTEDE
jgi:tetrahydromethanopterin S-methyltransferase subunit G